MDTKWRSQSIALPRQVDLLGRAVPVVRTPDWLRAVNKGKPGNQAQIEKYLAGKFRAQLDDARAAMEELAGGPGAGRATAARVPAL